MTCSNQQCAIACMDKDYMLRLDEPKYYEGRVDFSRCHDLWKENSIELEPVNMDKLVRYILIAGLACSINIKVLISAVIDLIRWSKKDGHNWLTGPGTELRISKTKENLETEFFQRNFGKNWTSG